MQIKSEYLKIGSFQIMEITSINKQLPKIRVLRKTTTAICNYPKNSKYMSMISHQILHKKKREYDKIEYEGK